MADFQVAEKMLQFAFREEHKSFFTPSPRVIIHPMEKLEGGLTEIEVKAFRELCIGAGARQVVVYMGDELFLNNIDFEQIKHKGF